MKSMRDAIKDAGIKPEDIDYVNVHGTSTPAGDIPELKAVAGVLGDHVYNVNISSTKSMTGHLLGAAGAAEALALHLRHHARRGSPDHQLREPRPGDRPEPEPHAEQGAEARSEVCPEQYVRFRRT